MARTTPTRETETKSLREAIVEALREEMARDERVVVMGEDVGETGHVNNLTEGLYEQFGAERVRDTPLSEAGVLGTGVGAAATGLRPVVDMMFSDFLGVATEQALNQLTKMHYMFGGKIEIPMVVRSSEGAGLQAAAQHSKTPHTIFAHMAGTKAVAPGTPAAAKGLMKAAIRSQDPVFFFDNKLTYAMEGAVPTDEEFTVPLGAASVERDGTDVTVAATQRFVDESLAVAEDLASDVDVEVLDLRSLYPLDGETVAESVRKTGRLVVADESPLSYGTHAEVLARINERAFWSLDAPMQRVGVPDTPVPFSPSLEDEVVPDESTVRAAIERIVP
jgi:pyruvate dehydrogenase E1 component beta subunit